MSRDSNVQPAVAILRSKKILDLVAAVVDAGEGSVGEVGWESPADAGLAVDARPPEEGLPARALCAVVSDLVRQGWGVKVGDEGLSFERPQPVQGDVLAEKARLRAQKLT